MPGGGALAPGSIEQVVQFAACKFLLAEGGLFLSRGRCCVCIAGLSICRAVPGRLGRLLAVLQALADRGADLRDLVAERLGIVPDPPRQLADC